MTSILIAGASKGVGYELAALLRSKDQAVIGVLRSEDARAKLEALGARAALADATDAEAVRTVLDGAGAVDAVVCTVGGKPGDSQRADLAGARNWIDACKAAEIERFILVSAIGCGESRSLLPPPVLERIGEAVAEKDKAEDHLRGSGLRHTIVRPGGLEDGPPTGNGWLTDSNDVLGAIRRADVADLLEKCLRSDRSVGHTFAAVDRDKVGTKNAYEEFAPA